MARRNPLSRSCCGLGALMLAGCALRGDPPPAAAVPCVAPRPEVCTMDYTPACGFHGSGASRTYSNACSACADASVVAYLPGACAD